MANIHIFPTFFHHFCFALWAQRAPPRPPLLARARSQGPSEAPPRIATAPPGPKRAPRAAENRLLMKVGRPIQLRFREMKSTLPVWATATIFEKLPYYEGPVTKIEGFTESPGGRGGGGMGPRFFAIRPL